MKKIYIILGTTLLLLASPMGEERALALFNGIKQSEYDWVIEQWDGEMKIKTNSRSSTRKSVWKRDENVIDIRSNEALINMANTKERKSTEAIIETPILPPNNTNTNDNLSEPKEPIKPIEPIKSIEFITVPSIK